MRLLPKDQGLIRIFLGMGAPPRSSSYAGNVTGCGKLIEKIGKIGMSIRHDRLVDERASFTGGRIPAKHESCLFS